MARGGSGAGSHGLSGREVPVPTKRRPTFPGTGGALTAGPLAAVSALIELHKPAPTPAVHLGAAAALDSVGQFLSYARLVRCFHESAGKKLVSAVRRRRRKIAVFEARRRTLNAFSGMAPSDSAGLLLHLGNPSQADGTPLSVVVGADGFFAF